MDGYEVDYFQEACCPDDSRRCGTVVQVHDIAETSRNSSFVRIERLHRQKSTVRDTMPAPRDLRTHKGKRERTGRQTWKRENNIEQYRLSREFSAECVYCTPRLIAVNRSIPTVVIAVPRSRVVVDALLACILLNFIIAFLLENTTKIAVSGRMKTALYARR